jgi:hypothetical protein
VTQSQYTKNNTELNFRILRLFTKLHEQVSEARLLKIYPKCAKEKPVRNLDSEKNPLFEKFRS